MLRDESGLCQKGAVADQVRVLFMADTHLGFDLPIRPRIERRRRGHDIRANFQRVIQAARDHRVHGVIHGGDLFHRSRVAPQLVDMVFAPLKQLADAGVHIYIVPGNHERSQIPHSELSFHPKIHVFTRPRTFVLRRADRTLAISGFAHTPEIRRRFRDVLAATDWRRIPAQHRLLCMHQCVEGATVGPNGYRFRRGKDILPGRDLPVGFDAILAGHIHRHQILRRDLRRRPLPTPVLYPGAIDRISFAEAEEAKGYLLLTIGPGARQCQWRFRRLPVRPMVSLDLRPDRMTPQSLTGWLAAQLAALPADAIVRLRIAGRVRASHKRILSAGALRRLAPQTMNLTTTWVD